MKQMRNEYPSYIKVPCVLVAIIAVGYLAIFAKELRYYLNERTSLKYAAMKSTSRRFSVCCARRLLNG